MGSDFAIVSLYYIISGMRLILTLSNFIIYDSFGIETLEYQGLGCELTLQVIPSVFRISPKIVGLSKVIREDNICRHSIV